MAKRTIFKDKAACLYKKCREVTAFDARLSTLIDDMAETMYDADGCGLAASQVGILRRVFVVDTGDGLMEFVNPEILETSGEQGGNEGCLSFPGETGYVVRPNYVKVRAQNRKGEMMEYEGTELFARAVLHENDHLNGQVYLRLVTEPPEGEEQENEEEVSE